MLQRSLEPKPEHFRLVVTDQRPDDRQHQIGVGTAPAEAKTVLTVARAGHSLSGASAARSIWWTRLVIVVIDGSPAHTFNNLNSAMSSS